MLDALDAQNTASSPPHVGLGWARVTHTLATLAPSYSILSLKDKMLKDTAIDICKRLIAKNTVGML